MEALVELPGVGRKTANVVLGHALGVPGLPVDRHVLRVSNRIGIAKSEDPVEVEQQLGKALPRAQWTKASDTLIFHGRRVCKPKPLCDMCSVRDDCDYYRKIVSKGTDLRHRSEAAGADECPATDKPQAVRPALPRAGLGRQAPEGDRTSARRCVSRDRSRTGCPDAQARAAGIAVDCDRNRSRSDRAPDRRRLPPMPQSSPGTCSR